MAADGILGLGARLYYSTNGTDYTELTDLEEIGPPQDETFEQIENTPLNPTNRRREYLNGLVDSGSFTFKQKYKKARMTALRGRLNATTYWKIMFPDGSTSSNGSTFVFQGNLTKCPSSPLQKSVVVTIDCEVKITGDITFTEGS